MKYTFGTCRVAANRLESMAAFWNPRAERLIREHLPSRVRLAIDLPLGVRDEGLLALEAVEDVEVVELELVLVDLGLRFAADRVHGLDGLVVEVAPVLLVLEQRVLVPFQGLD